jgi:adenylylsulfate kinase
MTAFALWLTGLPASGKSTLARAIAEKLAARGVRVETLESDAVRKVLTPQPTYAPEERDLFYRALAFTGARLVANDVNVIFDATANRRAHRQLGRDAIARFLEVHVDCPLAVCRTRDYKGTYHAAETGASRTVPGTQAAYEAPEHPELRIDSTAQSADAAAERVLALLAARGFI